jgi:hypothetical protein
MKSILARLWERHKNPWSWFMRPVFGIGMFYGAWLQSWPVLLLGVFGLATSWCWFPKPQKVHPWVERFIEVEKLYVTPPWTTAKLGALLAVLLLMSVSLAAFWQHSLKFGLLLMFFGGLAKSIWSLKVAGRAGLFAAAFGVFWALLAGVLFFQIK